MGRIVLLSDLHMGAGGSREQFRAMLETAQLENFAVDPTVSDIVLLGDSSTWLGRTSQAVPSELPSPGSGTCCMRTRPWWRRCAPSCAAGCGCTSYRATTTSSWRAPTRKPPSRRASPEDAGAVQFLPWLYHLPGLLLAEHGNQHHDLNAFDTVLRPLSGGDGLVVQPFGGQLSRLRNTHRGAPLLHRAAWAAAREGARLSGSARRQRWADYRRDVLPAYAAEVGLTEDCVLRLDRLGQHQPAAIMARLVRQSVRRCEPGYLVRAAHAVREALGDATPPFLVMGHGHGADARLLPSDRYDAPVVYLNTGTWSLRGPRARDTTLPPVTSTWVEVEPSHGSGPARARVLHLADDGTATVLAEADATGRVARAPDASPHGGIRQSDYAP